MAKLSACATAKATYDRVDDGIEARSVDLLLTDDDAPIAWLSARKRMWMSGAMAVAAIVAFAGLMSFTRRSFEEHAKAGVAELSDSSDIYRSRLQLLSLNTNLSYLQDPTCPAYCKPLGPPPYAPLPGFSCGQPCSFVDCPLTYNLTEVNESATKQLVDPNTSLFQEVEEQAVNYCNSRTVILAHGGWCYNKSRATFAVPNHYVPHSPPEAYEQYAVQSQASQFAGLDKIFLLPEYHVLAELGFVQGVAEVLKGPGGRIDSLIDLGAGVGQMGHALRFLYPQLDYRAFDGGGNVEDFTEGYVEFADLTFPLATKPADWVLFSEVGEHIPHEKEQQVITNLHALNCKGIILTWAILGQAGHGHINCHSNAYLINIFQALGYKLNVQLSEDLRRRCGQENCWLKRSAMVLERITTPPSCASSSALS